MATNPALASYPAVQIARAGVMPAASQYVSAEDQLQVSCWNGAAGAQLEVRWRIMRADGVVVTDHQSVPLTSARATVAVMLPLCEGFLLGVTASVSGATPKRGQCFVQIGLARGNTTNPEQGAILISDYCTNLDFASYPGGIVRSPVEGPGVLRSIAGSAPAAGAEIVETVPTNARWRLAGVHFTIVASVAVATRVPTVVIDDGVNILLRVPVSINVTASQNAPQSFSALSYAPQQSGFDTYSPFWNGLVLPAGFRWRTQTANIQAADQYSAVQYLVEEWIDV